MNAFGKRGGVSGGQRPSFGVAKPMKGGPSVAAPEGGDQFPPIEDIEPQEYSAPLEGP